MKPDEQDSFNLKTVFAALRHGALWYVGWSIAGLLRDGYIDWIGGLCAAVGASTVMYFLVGKDSQSDLNAPGLFQKLLQVPLWMIGLMVALAMFVAAFVFQEHAPSAPQEQTQVPPEKSH